MNSCVSDELDNLPLGTSVAGQELAAASADDSGIGLKRGWLVCHEGVQQ